MICYYSGSAGHTKSHGEPEKLLAGANVMLSYYLILTKWQKQHLRFPRILKSRQSQWRRSNGPLL